MTLLRTTQPVAYSRIAGVGGLRGEKVVPNDEIVGPIDSSDEWIRQRTGIVTRRRATAEQTVRVLAVGAGKAALAAAGLNGADLGAVVVSSISHLSATPSLAAVVAADLDAVGAAAYDISAACAGYCYGIGQADALVRSGIARHVLVIGVEKMSDMIDPTDRSISFLLGDGAGAAVVSASDSPGIGPTVWGSDGTKADLIHMTDSYLAYRDGVDVTWPTLRQEGPSVFKWAAFEMAKVGAAAISAAGVNPEDIEVFLPHQANMRIIDQLRKTIGLREDVVVGRDIADTGNTSAASIPLATERLLREGQAHGGQIALQIGFGAGLVHAAQVVVLPEQNTDAQEAPHGI